MIVVRTERISKEAVDAWFAMWQLQQQAIHEAHSKRDKTVKKLMEQAIAHYEQFVLAASDVATLDIAETYELFPINGMERLQFVKMRPGQYACYRQLDELFIETKKRCARLRLKK
ncbi:YpoC family protein [Kurthia huakuii]|uniref:YpoC family protein n=1 Tax=Kurthia huakuii TaxID=1421019 RepID=UPI0004962EA1|nr:hypothetical protein [Kurthia huakuii]MBM7699060.1 hypothetical protein [Kurthia huakuii]